MNQKKRLSVKTVVLIGMFGALAAVQIGRASCRERV